MTLGTLIFGLVTIAIMTNYRPTLEHFFILGVIIFFGACAYDSMFGLPVGAS